jgi:putative transcriptional regulator
MRLTWVERPLIALVAIVLPASLLHAALQDPGAAPSQPSLAGQILIAAPSLRDPRFDHTVVLMVRHNAEGAFGIVINRSVGETPFKSVLAAIGEKDEGVSGNLRVFYGGPVQPEVGFVLHSTDYQREQTVKIDPDVAMTSSREILRDIASGHGPQKSLVAFGYAGWGAGQLEGELALKGWYTAVADSKLVFDTDRDKVWDEAMARRTQDL